MPRATALQIKKAQAQLDGRDPHAHRQAIRTLSGIPFQRATQLLAAVYTNSRWVPGWTAHRHYQLRDVLAQRCHDTVSDVLSPIEWSFDVGNWTVLVNRLAKKDEPHLFHVLSPILTEAASPPMLEHALFTALESGQTDLAAYALAHALGERQKAHDDQTTGHSNWAYLQRLLFEQRLNEALFNATNPNRVKLFTRMATYASQTPRHTQGYVLSLLSKKAAELASGAWRTHPDAVTLRVLMPHLQSRTSQTGWRFSATRTAQILDHALHLPATHRLKTNAQAGLFIRQLETSHDRTKTH